MFRLRSVSNMTSPAAKTGTDNITKMHVNSMAHTNNGIWLNFNPGHFNPKMVTTKLMEASIELRPTKCRLNTAKSTEAPELWILNGGYKVHPQPGPCSIRAESNRMTKAAGFNQKLMLFRRGNAISGAPIKSGTKKLPKPPNKLGITMKNIMITA